MGMYIGAALEIRLNDYVSATRGGDMTCPRITFGNVVLPFYSRYRIVL